MNHELDVQDVLVVSSAFSRTLPAVNESGIVAHVMCTSSDKPFAREFLTKLDFVVQSEGLAVLCVLNEGTFVGVMSVETFRDALKKQSVPLRLGAASIAAAFNQGGFTVSLATKSLSVSRIQPIEVSCRWTLHQVSLQLLDVLKLFSRITMNLSKELEDMNTIRSSTHSGCHIQSCTSSEPTPPASRERSHVTHAIFQAPRSLLNPREKCHSIAGKGVKFRR